MFDPQKLLEQFLGGKANPDGSKTGGMSPDFMKGLATGGMAGGLAGLLLGSKGGKKMVGGATKLGGTAALAALAYKAYTAWQESKSAPSQPAASSPMKDITPQPAALAAPDSTASLAILRAMIAAAKADGHIDAAEQQKIFSKLDEMSLGTEEKAFIMDELRKPADIDALVAAATSPEIGLQIYAASLMAIDPDHPAEKEYLAKLAAKLGLDPSLQTAIQKEALAVA
jgi:uncharacterized membrane protein YebE (DUF533 family)